MEDTRGFLGFPNTQDGRPLSVGPEAEMYATALDECLADYGTQSQRRERLLALADKFYDIAARKFERISGQDRRRAGDADMDLDEVDDDSAVSPASDDEKRRWMNEAQTWDLVRRILPYRYPDAEQTSPHQPNDTTTDDLWGSFLSAGGRVAERKTVLEWLQNCDATTGPPIDDLVQDLQESAERGEIIAHGWIHTRTAVKLHKGLVGTARPLDPQSADVAHSLVSSTKAPLVSQLDPDAVTRQSRKLQPQDEYFERSIWVGCFHLLRRGESLEAIRDWCSERTEAWRAVAMSPMPLSMESSTPVPKNMANSLALWRRTCFAAARHGGADDVERAVYGILAGDVPSVEKVCKSWNDLLFMHYNALLRSQFDDYILTQCSPGFSTGLGQSFPAFDATQFHGDPETAEQRLIRSLASNNLTSAEASEPFKVLQAALLSKDACNYFHEQGLVVASTLGDPHSSPREPVPDSSKYFEAHDYGGLRVIAHLLIVLANLDAVCPARNQPAALSTDPRTRSLQEKPVVNYVELIRRAQMDELIPLYCSKLMVPHAYETLSRNLMHITQVEGRVMQLELIRSSSLDAAEFVRLQLQQVFNGLGQHAKRKFSDKLSEFRIVEGSPPSPRFGRIIKTDFFGEDPDNIEEADEHLIRSLEWLLLVEECWADVFAAGVDLYKYFLGNMRLNSARQLANRVSVQSVLGARIAEGMEEFDPCWVPDGEDSFWAEQLESLADAHVNPRRLASQARTFRDLECLIKSLDIMETIASLMELSREDPSAKRDFWTQVSAEVKIARTSMEPLLNNWLVASASDEALQQIRDAYLPECVLSFVSTLQFAGVTLSRDHLLECMDLAAVVASKSSDVAACFVRVRRMKELVESFTSCSKALAVTQGDKKPSSLGSKKMRELGWSRDLWTVKS